jgi:hypothetical protein
MFCFSSGTGLRSLVCSGVLVRLMLFSALLSMLRPVGAVCQHCQDFIPACPGGDKCPTIVHVAGNAEEWTDKGTGALPQGLPSMIPPDLLAVFSRQAMDSIVGLVTAPRGGGQLDFSTDAYSSANAVVKAAFSGKCTIEDAALELGERLGSCVPRGD